MPPVVLLGPQRRNPTLPRVMRDLALPLPYAVITAGWNEREGETDELRHDLGGPVVELGLYRRANELFEADPELRHEHRARQDLLRRMQEIYRLRLGHALAALREVFGLQGPEELMAAERESAVEAVRMLDRHHIARVSEVRHEFNQRFTPNERPHVVRHRDELTELIDGAGAVLVAGGHVATLLNRMRIFDIGPLMARKPVIAWSAGAMTVSELVVVFHDSPPQGPGDAEVLDHGLGLTRGLLPLPHASRRLHLDDQVRVASLARRFDQLRPLTLDEGALVEVMPTRAEGVRLLCPEGTHREWTRSDG